MTLPLPSHPAGPHETIPCGGRAITIEVFAPTGKDASATATVILLHDAEGPGLGRPVRREAAALACAGFRVRLPHYLDRTGDVRVGFSAIGRHFEIWREVVEATCADASTRPGGAPSRIALVGRSLGGALALAVAARAPAAAAALVVRSAFLPPELGDGPLRLPPVLALHGARDAIVGPNHAVGLRDRATAAGGSAHLHLYETQAHVFDAATDADAVARTIGYLKDRFA